MLTQPQKKLLAKIHDQTSDPVREWMAERIEACQSGNPWAEQALRVFMKEYRNCGSGVRAYMYLVGDHEQLQMDAEQLSLDTTDRVVDPS